MSYFSFTVPGQPVSWNAAYKTKNGQPGMHKTDKASEFQRDVVLIAAAARNFPIDKQSRLIIAYEFTLQRDIDCDNLLKLLNDAIAWALDINDRHFMPVVISKTTRNANPQTRVTVYDATRWKVSITEQ